MVTINRKKFNRNPHFLKMSKKVVTDNDNKKNAFSGLKPCYSKKIYTISTLPHKLYETPSKETGRARI